MSGQDVATWLQAVGSAGSLLAFAAWVGIAIINRKDDHTLRFERQAQTVAAWVDKGPDHGCDEDYVVCVVNGGEAPVYDCRVSLPGLLTRKQPGEVFLQLVPPHSTKPEPPPTPLNGLSWEDIYESGIAPELTFRDSSGRRWQRDRDGILTEL